MLGLSLKESIAVAYDVKDYQVSGPGWIESERYDAIAKIPSDVVKLPEEARWRQVRAMGRALLADRFKAALHRGTRGLPVYRWTGRCWT
jgi:uncharacterized protein (TIGR03435 family)